VSERIRVLVVDDSAVIRRIVSDAVSGDPGMEVVGVAANGKLALEQLARLSVDVVTLDVEMPEMDGLETLRAIRKTNSRLPVIMFSAVTERGARTTIEALTSGANDYLCKVGSGEGGVSNAVERVRSELLPRIKGLVAKARLRGALPGPAPRTMSALERRPGAAPSAALRAASAKSGRVDLLAIGVSTGGPAALSAVLPKLPAHFSVPIVVVQHMPALFTKMLAERLAGLSPLRVEEAKSGQPLVPGTVFIAPGDFHMVVTGTAVNPRIGLNQEPHENGCRPAIDPLFRSVATLYGDKALALVLTGMGSDGLKGSQELYRRGARVWVQDESSSVVWGMPGAISRAGLADQVLDLDHVAPALLDVTGAGPAPGAGGRPGRGPR